MVSSVVACSIVLDWHLKRKSSSGEMKPEYRLPPLVVGGIIIPVGLFIFGWTIEVRAHWIVPVIATSLIGFGFVAASLASWSYLVDAFGIYAASALAAATVVRNVMAALLPLAGPPLFSEFGYGWGSSVLGFVALVFAPLSVLLIRYGESLRHSSKFKHCA